MDFIEANWLLILLVAIAAIVILWYIFHAARRTRVTGDTRDVLDEGAAPAARNQALIDSAPAATRPAPIPRAPAGLAGVGEAVESGVLADAEAARTPVVPSSKPSAADASPAPSASATAAQDDLTRIKGVGPKLAALLRDLGVTTLSQIAAWSDNDIDRIDPQLGRFQGRIRRDAWVEQARLLDAGDETGYAARFGNQG